MTSIHDNLTFWAIWLIFLGVCAHQIVWSLRSQAGILGFVPVVCTMFTYIFVIEGGAIVSSRGDHIHPAYFAMGEAVGLLCLLGLLAGWYKGLGRPVIAKSVRIAPAQGQMLWYAGVGAMMVGIFGQYYFYAAIGNDYSGSAYLYLLYHVAYPGLAICVFLASSDPQYRSNNNILLIMALGFIMIAPWVYGVRRAPVFTFVIICIYSFYMARPRRVNRGVVLGGLAAVCVMMLFFLAIRDYVSTEGSWSSRKIQKLSASNVLLDKAYEEYDNEFIYSCCITATCYELDRYQWGTSYLSLASHWIPRSWWPDKPAIAQGWFEPATWQELREVTGIMPSNGSSYSGIGESFQDFSWFTPLFWAGLGWCFGRLYRYSLENPTSVAPILYVGMIAASHYLVMQGFASLFVPAMVYLVTPIVAYVIAGNVSGQRLARRPVRARPHAGQFGRVMSH